MNTFNLGHGSRRIHFIGIGGISMSALAEILHSQGHAVSGSNDKETETASHLREIGIDIRIEHDKVYITDDIELIVYTVAVKNDNPELCAAREKNIKIIDRAALLGLLMESYKKSVAVSGSHGKTTTTTLISDIILHADLDPTIMVGGIMGSTGSNMRYGHSEYFIAEADEYYNSFLKFYSHIGVILNIEYDHPDFFGSFTDIENSFQKFAHNISADGALIINKSVKNIEHITDSLCCKIITYDISDKHADWNADNIVFDAAGMPAFDILHNGCTQGRVQLKRNGMHNILNALAATAACYELGVSIEVIISGLASSPGPERRFQYKGSFNGVTVVDDYAHHPTEIKVNLFAAKKASYNNIWCVFQPHTYSRTKALLQEFSEAFDEADKIVLLDIFSARPGEREKNAELVHSLDLAEKIKQRGKEVYYFSSFDEAESFLLKQCATNDLLITMGAGDIYRLGEKILKTGLSTLSTELLTNTK